MPEGNKGYLCFASMVKNAARGPRGEDVDDVVVTLRRLQEARTGRPASEVENSSHFFCLVSVSDMRSGECRLTRQLSVAAGGEGSLLKSSCVVI